ncbi:MAG: hypothetical protein NWT08_11385 [Akkermansiaceae bacterium]|jgi:hypothetical protein|nr:hypothetical protein [Akkermansiaceae bacterium]MDP4646120.1 hypothetical protein [Akkermansiaceae bacterium]MDP4720919.1 hypothetical protein [Akkermansiaceae bacterium]MDP4780722.1 hypothetical protein [Akkermansiaceae bacterium]MDP4845668.1 hypothetical protein [Akkermansiaceae bacterium]
MKKNLNSIAGGILSLFLTLQAPAALFVAPEEGGCTLRIDRVPLDVDTMSELSDGLAVIAQSPVDGFPARVRRSSAQALALALALDPASETAHKTLSNFTAGEQQDPPAAEELIQAKAVAWQLHSWLSTPEAGEEGRQLAGLMGDSLRFLDPEHPSAIALKDSPESGNWEGWVAGLDAFKQIPGNNTPEKPEKSDVDPFEDIKENMPEEKVEEKPIPTGSQILLTEASIRTFLYEKAEESERYELKPVNITMNARKANEGEQGFFVQIEANEDHDKIRDQVAQPIYQALIAALETKPAPGRISLKAGEKSYRFNKNADNLTGPGFVLATSALSGIAPVGTIIARLDENGNPAPPAEFWNILRDMTGEETGRLIIPASAEKYMLGLLTMEEKSFFLRYEVLIASTPAEMIALSSSKPSPEHSAAFARFDEIRKKSEGQSTGVYVANRFVLQRLQELSAEAPYHLSAKFLAMQGAGKRPRALPREFLAAELLRITTPIKPIANYNMPEVKKDTLAKMDQIQKECREAIEELDRITDIRDRDLLDASRDMTTSLRALIRELGKSGDYWDKNNAIEKSKIDLNARISALRTGLSQISKIPISEK